MAKPMNEKERKRLDVLLGMRLTSAEVDTVIGRVGGKVLFTDWLPSGLMLAFLRRRRTSDAATRLFRVLRHIAGDELFQRLFAVILAVNGSEFSNPAGIEKPVVALGPADRPHNPVQPPSRCVYPCAGAFTSANNAKIRARAVFKLL